MSNKSLNQNRIPINSIRLQKSNSEANHKNKKIFRESRHNYNNKINKIPREKIFQSNQNSKQKQKSIINFHQHISSQNSPYCIICGSINYINNEPAQIIESIKPHNYNYTPEFSITSMINRINSKTNIEYQNIFSEFKNKHINLNIISIRNKIIKKFIEYSKKILISKNTIYLAIILMDIIILNKNINTKKKIEQISLGCYFLAVKFLDFAVNSFNIKEFQYTNEIAMSYSLEQIRKFEVNCLKNVKYNLSVTIFINILQIFLSNGILLKNDIKITNSEQSLKNIYYLINKISENLIYDDMKYIQFNQFKMACAILYLSRNISKLEPWPTIFIQLYNIKFEEFSEEYNYVNNFCENNTLLSNFGNKKKDRNSCTCKSINMKRINFNSSYNNRFYIHNGIIYNKESSILNDNNSSIKNNILHYNDKNNSSCYFNGNNNISLFCDTTSSNVANYFSNNDSSKKYYNYSGGKVNSKKKSYENNSKESKKDKRINILNSSSKYIRTHHKLIKGNHQNASNQSMEMPRKTYIFQKRIYHSRSKKKDNDNKINSNWSQRIEKKIYNYNINKKSYNFLNLYNIENDKINKDDNKKNSEKKNNFRKILNNSELQVKKKNNSQTNLLAFNIKKFCSVKLIVDNSKKNNLSNISNGKSDIIYHNNNNIIHHSNRKDNKIIKKNLNYSNVIQKKGNKNKNIYYNYKNNNNNNSSIKKEYDISKEHKEISANLSFITITDSYMNSQKKYNFINENKNNNIKIIDNNMKINNINQKDIDSYKYKNHGTNIKLSNIKYNSCINNKISKFNLCEDKSLSKKLILKKEDNTSYKEKHSKDKNYNHNTSKNYKTNIILSKQNKISIDKNNNIIIKINLMNTKYSNINRNHIIRKNSKKSKEGIGIIKKIKINNINVRRKETSKRKRVDGNISSFYNKNNNSNNNSSLVNYNNRSNGNINGKTNSDGYTHKNIKKCSIKNNRYNNINKRGRNYSMIVPKKLKSSNFLL